MLVRNIRDKYVIFNSLPLSFYFPLSGPKNMTGVTGEKNYLLRLAAVVLTGVLAGLSGMVLAMILHAIQHLAFGYSLDRLIGTESFLQGVTDASWPRRFTAIVAGGAIAGFGWWLLGRYDNPARPVADSHRGAGLPARSGGCSARDGGAGSRYRGAQNGPA